MSPGNHATEIKTPVLPSSKGKWVLQCCSQNTSQLMWEELISLPSVVLFTKESILRAKSKASEWAYLWEVAAVWRLAWCSFCFFPDTEHFERQDKILIIWGHGGAALVYISDVLLEEKKRYLGWWSARKGEGMWYIQDGLRNAEIKVFNGERAEIPSKILYHID